MDAAIKIQNFTKAYKEFAIRGLNLTVPKGYITGFIGRNGAGKTTTLKGILNLIRFEGEIQLLGEDNRACERELRERIGVVMEPDGFPGDLPAERLVRIIRPFYPAWQEGRFRELAGRFGLDLSKRVSELSRGMRVKLALALALSHNAELLLLDEPTAGLDPLVREEILDLFMELIQDENRSVFFSTHITSDLDKAADYIILMEQGRVLLNQPKDQLLEDHLLVRGGPEELAGCRDALVGYKTNRFGFEGLARRERLHSRGLQTERPNVEQLMHYYIRGNEDGRH